MLRAGFLLHLRLKIGYRRLHHSRGIEHRRQLHFARSEQVAHRLHAVEQHRVDQVERRVVDQRSFQQLLQAALRFAVAHRFLAVDDCVLQLVFDRKRFDVRRGLGLRLAFHAREMLHVNLQRIPIRPVLVNELARQFHFFRRNRTWRNQSLAGSQKPANWGK